MQSHFLHLESDGGLDFVHLLHKALAVSDQGGKLSRLAQTGTQQARDLLDEAVRCQESVIPLG